MALVRGVIDRTDMSIAATRVAHAIVTQHVDT